MSDREDSALFSWSTDACPKAERFDAYVDVVCKQILHVQPAKRTPCPFEIEIQTAPLGPLKVATVRGSAREAYRTRQSIEECEPAYHLLIGTSATWCIVSHGAPLEMRPGDLVLLDTRLEHGYRTFGNCDTCAVKMPLSWLEAWVPSASQMIGKVIAHDSTWGRVLSPLVQNLKPKIIQHLCLPGHVIADEIGALIQLTSGDMVPSPQCELSSSAAAPSSQPLAKWRLRRTMEYLDAHLREHIGLGDLSAVAGLSRMRFASQFRAAVGEAPYTYVIRRRIQEAQKLLLDPSWTIAAVASEMGFADQAHFTRMFKKIAGVTPRRWRMTAMN